MPPRDTKQSEKDYLRRSAAGEWERYKPFPPPGQAATEEHARLLLDFVVLLRVLDPSPSDLVLDLGAGSCWCSEWLRRFGVRTIALDIALDMLRLGQTRLGGPGGLIAGDMEKLPFATGAFPKACCLNAFHHVGDMDRALSEIVRVLKTDGVAFFAEPGVGHADHPTSVAATRDFGVLEQEVLIEDFMERCRRAGFADVRLHPISHVVPLFELDSGQWHAWRTYTRSKRPVRAFEKLRRAAMEVIGLGKKDVLFEEAFAIRLLRELEPVIEQHPIITAHKSPIVRREGIRDGATIRLVSAPSSARPGEVVSISVTLLNSGATMWPVATSSAGHVRLGVQLLAEDRGFIDREYLRQDLPRSVAPGESCEVSFEIRVPSHPGIYHLKLDLVREGVAWFEMVGSPVLLHRIAVA